jgi:hypothetical protein
VDRPVRTSYSIRLQSFISYALGTPTKLICNYREFKAVVDYMEAVQGMLSVDFDEAGE